MYESVWMRPALRSDEAVRMPAGFRTAEPTFSDGYARIRQRQGSFVPVTAGETTVALSTYVRPRGSMAGRSVLRAAGISEGPLEAMTFGARRAARGRRAHAPRWRTV